MMLLAYAIAVIALHSGFGTNYMESERHGDVWLRTNVTVFTNVSAVVGEGILPQRHTNSTAVATNTTWMMVVNGRPVPVPMMVTNGSWVITNWHNVTIGMITNYDDSRLTNLPPVPKR